MSTDRFLSVKVGDLMTREVVNPDASMTAIKVARQIVKQKIETCPFLSPPKY